MMPHTYSTDAADSRLFRMSRTERVTEVFYGYRFPNKYELAECVAEQQGVSAVDVLDVTGPEPAGIDGYQFTVYYRVTEV